MLERQSMDAARLPQKSPDQVQIVNTVIQDLHTRQSFQESPQMPRGVNRHAKLHFVKFSNQALLDQAASGKS